MKNLIRLVCLALLPSAFSIQAQSLVVNLESGGADSYALTDVRSITFPSGEMSVNFTDGTAVSWPIGDVRSYSFIDLTTDIHAAEAGRPSLRTYPNPSNGTVRIAMQGDGSPRVRIDLLDMTGRWLESVYDGAFPSTGLDVQHHAIIASGPCMLRATTAARTTTLPLIINR